MKQYKDYLLLALGCGNTILVSFFGKFTPLFYTVLLLMFFDLVSRMYAAGMRTDDQIKSKKVISGIGSKFGMIMLIGLSLIMDYGLSFIASMVLPLLNIESPFRIIAVMPFTLAWIFLRECTSICENLEYGGVKLPGIITKALNLTTGALDKFEEAMSNDKSIPLIYPNEEEKTNEN